jgi:hypothetical protein
MSREFMRVAVIVEYPVDPDLYPGSTTPGQRADVDLKNFTEDPKTLIETITEFGVKSIRIGSFTIE